MDILSRYGIKEVADVTFYKIQSDGTPGAPVLYLDTLKVSTIEQTAETASARGGKGNAELIMWDYGKEITVNLEDALFSAKSMAMMYGVDVDDLNGLREAGPVRRTVKKGNVSNYNKGNGDGGTAKFKINGVDVNATQVLLYNEFSKLVEDLSEAIYATGTIGVSGTEIVISADKFPGTYYITGDTYARSETTGQDEHFQFIIPKAKMLSEVTLTMEAEGDPTTFNMNLKVLRPANGEMMKLVKYQYTGILAKGVLADGIGTWEFNDEGTLTFTGGSVSRFNDVFKIMGDNRSGIGNPNNPVGIIRSNDVKKIVLENTNMIDSYTFTNRFYVEEVIVKSLNVSRSAFEGCSGLTSLTIKEPNNFMTISDYVVQKTPNLTVLRIEANGWIISSNAFRNSSLTKIIIYADEGSAEGQPWGSNAEVEWIGYKDPIFSE